VYEKADFKLKGGILGGCKVVSGFIGAHSIPLIV